jgi:diaminopimelate decarboxylase
MKPEVLQQLATEFGSPLYVYDADKIAFQYQRLQNAFNKIERFKVHYAVKALSNVSVLSYLKSLGAGLDTVSIQEVQLGLHAGVAPQDIIYTPNGVSMEEIEEVAQLGVQINIDNL